MSNLKQDAIAHAAASFAGFLLMNHEGDTVYEESLQYWMQMYLESEDYKAEQKAVSEGKRKCDPQDGQEAQGEQRAAGNQEAAALMSRAENTGQ